jgi:hypothetical protein
MGMGALVAVNPFYRPRILLDAGVLALCVDVVLVLILSWHRYAARVGVLVAGLFIAVPCFVRALALYRFLLMAGMVLTFAAVAAQVFVAPTAGVRERLAYLFTWMGTREVKRRARSFDAASLLRFIIATLVLAAAFAAVKAVAPSGMGWLARWFAGGILFLSFAEMTTAGHDFLTALMGLEAPALMRSPHLSASLSEFWGKRWNPAVSALVFGKLIFEPLARHGAGLAMFAAFLGSAIAHVFLLYMAAGRWGIAFMAGAFFLVQPPLLRMEHRMKARRWPPMVRRAWTLAALAMACPLIVEPVLQLIEPTWGAVNPVLVSTVGVLGIVIMVNGIVSLGSLASAGGPIPPSRILSAQTGAKWVLRFITLTTLPAFVAAVMPERWLVFGLHWVEPGCAPGLFGSYLIRCLMGVYAFVGIQTAIWSTDVRRYRPLILNLCVCILIAVPLALLALFIAVPQPGDTRAFWIIFIDLTEGFAQTGLLAILVRRVPDQAPV